MNGFKCNQKRNIIPPPNRKEVLELLCQNEVSPRGKAATLDVVYALLVYTCVIKRKKREGKTERSSLEYKENLCAKLYNRKQTVEKAGWVQQYKQDRLFRLTIQNEFPWFWSGLQSQPHHWSEWSGFLRQHIFGHLYI